VRWPIVLAGLAGLALDLHTSVNAHPYDVHFVQGKGVSDKLCLQAGFGYFKLGPTSCTYNKLLCGMPHRHPSAQLTGCLQPGSGFRTGSQQQQAVWDFA